MFTQSGGRYRALKTMAMSVLRATLRRPGTRTIFQNPDDRAQIYPDYVRVCNSFNVKCERVMYRKDLRGAIQRMLDANEPYVLDVIVPYSEHVIPFIPAGRTVADMIWKV